MGKNRQKNLGELLQSGGIFCDEDLKHIQVDGITDDSRRVAPGTLFVAISGMHVDGHRFIEQAVEKGCVAVLANRDFTGKCSVPLIRVDSTLSVLGLVAAAFYDFPCRQMKMVGITGTNGKTTTTYLLESVIRHCGGEPGIIGTINIRYKGKEYPASLTTPAPLELQSKLRIMADEGVSHVVMEVSSHALEQQRVNGVWFDVALFTNLSRDHLDFHGNMTHYYLEKEKLFTDHLKKGGRAVIAAGNIEGNSAEKDKWSEKLKQTLKEKNISFLTFGIEKGDIRTKKFTYNLKGITAEIVTPAGQHLLQSNLVGRFNLKNLLGTIGCAEVLGWELDTICRGLIMADGIPGRMEKVILSGERTAEKAGAVFVDYAHTPDALEKILNTLRELDPRRIFVVFGCGGDRDKGKRSIMGEIAAKLADIVLITTDNSRSESPGSILGEIEKGVSLLIKQKIILSESKYPAPGKGYCVVESRAQAIRLAINWAQDGDVVLISGKGHECYQITGNKKEFFDDRQQAREEMKKKIQSEKTCVQHKQKKIKSTTAGQTGNISGNVQRDKLLIPSRTAKLFSLMGGKFRRTGEKTWN